MYTDKRIVSLVENQLRRAQISLGRFEVPEFNPGSSKQKQELFSMLGIRSTSVSETTGDDSWDRDQIEYLLKVAVDDNLIDVLEAFIDHSFGGIIDTTFLKAFDSYTIDGTLYGTVKLGGTKTFRISSNSPNLLNMPSTKSVYAKPLKKCFIAPEGYLIWSIDYSALEDRVMANLSLDTNKMKVFTDSLDGHSLAAVFYDPIGTAEIVGEFTDSIAACKKLKAMVDEKDPLAKAFRQKYKGTSFGLAYGKFPDADRGGVITQELFDNYHNKLYPGITKYREEYVLETAREEGFIHMGLGAVIYTSDANKHIRSLNNATCQFWSILSLIAINELNYQKKEAGLDEDIIVNATIYDSIYGYVKKDTKSIKWLNDTLVPIMEKDFIEGQVVKNEADLELSDSWDNLVPIKNGASLKNIQEIVDTLEKRKYERSK